MNHLLNIFSSEMQLWKVSEKSVIDKVNDGFRVYKSIQIKNTHFLYRRECVSIFNQKWNVL